MEDLVSFLRAVEAAPAHLVGNSSSAFVGFSLDPSQIPPVLGIATALGVATAVTKFATGWLSSARSGVGTRGRARAGATLIARGEFSIAVAGLAVASNVEPELGPLAVSYVFLLAVVGPIAARLADPIADRLFGTSDARVRERSGGSA